MDSKFRNILLVVAIIVLVVSVIIYLFGSSFNLQNITSYFPGNQTSIKIPLTTPTGKGDPIPSIWVWLGNTRIISDSGNYYLTGNLGNNNKIIVKVYIGTEQTEIGYASTTTWNPEDPNFPESFPEWSIQKIGKVEVDSARSKYAIVKIYTASVDKPADCDDECSNLIGKQIELLDNNKTIENVKETATFDNLEIGPAIQILQVLEE